MSSDNRIFLEIRIGMPMSISFGESPDGAVAVDADAERKIAEVAAVFVLCDICLP